MIRLHEEFNTNESDKLIESINYYLARISKFIDKCDSNYTELSHIIPTRLDKIADDKIKDETYKQICSCLQSSLKYFKTLDDVLDGEVLASNLDRCERCGKDSIIDILTDANRS